MKSKNATKNIVTISAVIFVCLLICALIINVIKFANVLQKERTLKSKLNELDLIIQSNEEEIAYKSTDEYIEKYVRDYLNMIGKDEIAFTGK